MCIRDFDSPDSDSRAASWRVDTHLARLTASLVYGRCIYYKWPTHHVLGVWSRTTVLGVRPGRTREVIRRRPGRSAGRK